MKAEALNQAWPCSLRYAARKQIGTVHLCRGRGALLLQRAPAALLVWLLPARLSALPGRPGAPWDHSDCRFSGQLLTFHTRTFMSSLPLNTYVPSPLNLTANTRCMRLVVYTSRECPPVKPAIKGKTQCGGQGSLCDVAGPNAQGTRRTSTGCKVARAIAQGTCRTGTNCVS